MNGENKSDLSKIKLKLEKDSKSFWILVIFLGLITLVYLVSLWRGFGRKSFYQAICEYGVYQVIFQDGAYLSFILWLLPAIIIFMFWHNIRKNKKNNINLYKHVNSGTIVVKKAKITRFEYYYKADNDYAGTRGYYIMAMDGDISYKSELLVGAKLSEGYGKISIDKSCFRGNNNLVDENKLLAERSENNTVISKLGGILYNQNLYGVNDIYGGRPPSLMYEDKERNLGDEVIVYVDPDNPENYKMEI